MVMGRVRWFKDDKGYGFIDGPDGDVFVHFKDIVSDGHKRLLPGQAVLFEMRSEPKGLRAYRVRAADPSTMVLGSVRYRTVLHYEAETYGDCVMLRNILSNPPNWMGAMEQEVGMATVGTWPILDVGGHFIQIIHSQQPYKEVLRTIAGSRHADHWDAWQTLIREYTGTDPEVLQALAVTD